MQAKKIAYYGLFAALAILMGYVEMLIPLPVPLPGVKLGLANVVVVIMLYAMDAKGAFFISLVRVLLSGLLFAGFAGLLYSLAGAMCSFAAMALLKCVKRFSVVGVSIAGGVAHNIGQIAVAAMVLENGAIFYYLPVLLLSGSIAGAVIGFLGGLIVKRLQGVLKIQ